MTIPIERTYAVLNTRDFLRDLLDPKKTPKVPKDIRRKAARLLRHYPTSLDMLLASENREVFGKPEEDKLA